MYFLVERKVKSIVMNIRVVIRIEIEKSGVIVVVGIIRTIKIVVGIRIEIRAV